MNKFEIMLIVDPAIDIAMANEIVESVFDKKNINKAVKLENTTLAYPINKSTKAQYIVYTLEAKSELFNFCKNSSLSSSLQKL
ncbi:30S ribosomal protein S6, partial [Mycoplasmopsis bovis]|uniref:30S ribosomal protein S6 n=1 Tax=Mycoplasmopsis bovis TaxID=28903 RepID=UPI003D2B0B74